MNACLRALWLFPVLAVLVLSSSGCVKSKVTVFVNPDGSGHLVVSRLFGRQAIETYEMQRQQMVVDGDGAEEVKARMKADPFYDEKSLQREAKNYGSGVKLVKSRKIEMDGGRGSIAVYSFKDINDVFVSADINRFQQMMYGGYTPGMDDEDEDGGGRGGRRGRNGMEFSLQTGEVSRLKILMPTYEPVDDDDPQHDPIPEQGEDADGMAVAEMAEWFDAGMMSFPTPVGFDYRYADRYAGNMMQQGMAVGIEVAFNGKIVTGNAAHTNASMANRIVLLDVDSSRRSKKDKTPRRMDDLYNYYDFNRLMRGLSKVPGSIIETNREVVVTFK